MSGVEDSEISTWDQVQTRWDSGWDEADPAAGGRSLSANRPVSRVDPDVI